MAVAKGYRLVDDIILGGSVPVLGQVNALASRRESANVRLNDEWRAVIELRRMGELKSG